MAFLQMNSMDGLQCYVLCSAVLIIGLSYFEKDN